MDKLIEGLERFASGRFSQQKELYQTLVEEGQSPHTLFVTCSDSRVSPTVMTDADPGDLFVLRNAGNIIPPFGAGAESIESTVEYAMVALEVPNVVIAGHSHCGAITGLMQSEKVDALPSTKQWLRHAERTRRVLDAHCSHLEGDDRIDVAIQENVLSQIENLQTHPSVASRLATGDVSIHGWVIELEAGLVHAYDPEAERFRAVEGDGELPIASTGRARPSQPLGD